MEERERKEREKERGREGVIRSIQWQCQDEGVYDEMLSTHVT